MFNKIYKPDSINILSPACLPVEGGYMFAGSYGSFITLNHGFYIRKTDLEGETQWFQTFEYGNHTIYAIGGGILIAAHAGTYMLAGSRTYESGGLNQDIVMINFLEDGTHLWTKIIEKPDTIEYPYHITPTQDGGYIMCGIQRSFTTSNRFYVLKTDAFGNKEWDRVYNSTQHGAAFSVFELSNGYIISGGIYNTLTNYDMIVIRIDFNGNVVWQKYYGGNESDTACFLSPDFDGDTFLVIASVKDSGIRKPYILNIDSQGVIVWQKIYEMEMQAPQEAPILRTANGSAICMYGYQNQLNNYDTRIFKFTSTGDTLWTRTIPGLNPNDDWYLKDIAPTQDGGYIFSGFNYSQQSSWVVKTDSLGYTCSFIGCDSTAVIDNINIPPRYEGGQGGEQIRLLPNPAQDRVTLYLPPAIAATGGQLLVYNASGRLVWRAALPNYVSEYTFSVAGLPAGIYFCKVGATTQKLAVIR